jgi:hypothetical protein
LGSSFTTRETVERDTPACLAMSSRVRLVTADFLVDQLGLSCYNSWERSQLFILYNTFIKSQLLCENSPEYLFICLKKEMRGNFADDNQIVAIESEYCIITTLAIICIPCGFKVLKSTLCGPRDEGIIILSSQTY